MAVYHILSDGKLVNDITDHVVKMEEADRFYELLDSINRSRQNKKYISSNEVSDN